jgi:hypothetical protein
MSPQRPRRPYDRWRDVRGNPITDGARVQQVAVDKAHGALPSRLGRSGTVTGRTRSTRLYVVFDGENRTVSIRPDLVKSREKKAT